MLLSGKTAVITGCNRGIGKAILSRFIENGCSNIFAVVRNSNDDFLNDIEKMAIETETNIRVLCCDFSSRENIKSITKDIMSSKIPVDILVNNVGTNYTQKSLSLMKADELDETFQINFFSHLLLTQGVVRCMTRKNAGAMVFISSVAAFDGGANVAYVSSKAAICGAVKRLAIEYAPYGIRVNAIAPGLTDTDMITVLSDEEEKFALNMQIMGRKGEPKEIADVAVFLSSAMSSFITGQTIHVDGGIR